MKIIFISFFFITGFCKEIEEDLDTVETIKHYGYKVERHHVKTLDGYSNQVHRIPIGRDVRKIEGCLKRPVVFFFHGLFASSYEFVMNLPSQSPAYIFADAGFDVWMGNVRGTRYGKNHTAFTPKDTQFWNFTLYDHAHSDLRSQIEYVLEVTGQESVYYIGHSQGTITMFARLAESLPSWQKKIRSFFALGPTAGFKTPDILFELLEVSIIQKLAKFALDGKFGIVPITLPDWLMERVVRFCGQPILTHSCVSAIFFSQGFENLGQLNETRTPIMLKHFPDTTSTLNLLHWVQIFKYHEIRHLDFGPIRNEKIYGQKEAPHLNISNIQVPTYLYFSRHDHITDYKDVTNIIVKNMGQALKKSIVLDNFSHIDYVVGLRANDEVFRPIIYDIYEDIQLNKC